MSCPFCAEENRKFYAAVANLLVRIEGPCPNPRDVADHHRALRTFTTPIAPAQPHHGHALQVLIINAQRALLLQTTGELCDFAPQMRRAFDPVDAAVRLHFEHCQAQGRPV